jgi:hypothetical protein
MTARKNQAQPIILKAVLFLDLPAELHCASRYRAFDKAVRRKSLAVAADA